MLITVAVYGPVVRNGFVDYDDPAYVVANPHIRNGPTAESIAWAFTTGYHGNWHPLTWISHALDVRIFGLEPAGHHAVSLLIHALNSALLFLALSRMTGALWRPAMVAALFALHPLRVESVAWAAERKDVLSTFFGMTVLLAYWRHVRQPSVATRIALPVLLGLGLMAKPMLVTLPFALLLLDLWPLGRWNPWSVGGPSRWAPPWPLVREKLPLFVMAAASSIVTWAAQKAGGAVTALDVLPPAARLSNAVVAYVAYLARAAWPWELGVLYPIPASFPAWKTLGAVAILAAVSFAVRALARSAPYLLVGWVWYLGTLVPVIGLVQVGVQSSADRYTYIPLIGVFLAAVWGGARVLGGTRMGRASLVAFATLFLAGCAALTWRQIGYWRDSETLFRRTLAVTTDNGVIHNNLAGVLIREGRLDEAVDHLEQARRIRPNYVSALSNLGVARQGQGKVVEAVDLFREALRLDPAHVEAWLSLGNALAKIGDLKGALGAFREGRRLRPEEPGIDAIIRGLEERERSGSSPSGEAPRGSPEARARFERANVLRDQGLLEQAADQYREAIRLDPESAEAHNNLGSILGRQGRLQEAIREVSRAVELAPSLAEAHNNLGILLAVRGDSGSAESHFREAAGLDSRDPTARLNLGMLLAKQGRAKEAAEQLEEALRLQPGNDAARRALRQLREKRAASAAAKPGATR